MKTIIIAAFAIQMAFTANAQFQANQKAFSESYTLEANKQYSQAAEEIKKVYDEKSYEANLRLGWLEYAAGKQADAVNYYGKAIDLQPNAVEARLGIVYPLSVQNKWDDILKQYQAILKLDPQNSLVNYRTGLIYYNRQSYAEAKKYLETLLQLYPFDFDGLSLMGWTTLKLGKKSEAKSYFQRALLNHPSDKTTLEGLKAAE